MRVGDCAITEITPHGIIVLRILVVEGGCCIGALLHKSPKEVGLLENPGILANICRIFLRRGVVA